jgi:hypothetical protein
VGHEIAGVVQNGIARVRARRIRLPAEVKDAKFLEVLHASDPIRFLDAGKSDNVGAVAFAYHADVLATLAGHGLVPTPETPPAFVRSAVNDLYRFEIRALRDALLAGRVRKEHYIDRVLDLRRKYWLLSVPIERWTMHDAAI